MIEKNNPNYPELLAQIADPPKVIYQVGSLKQIPVKSVAIVGTRNATPYGIRSAEFITKLCVKQGYCIISGLARGIDTVVHTTAIKEGGVTVAVLGGNVNKPYPVINSGLYNKILQNGCVISEFNNDVCYEKYMFIRRNRIIAGLSQRVFVIEAPIKSGAMITAKFAVDYNRDLVSVPGEIFNENYQGCNFLIKNNMAEIFYCKPQNIHKDYDNPDHKNIAESILKGAHTLDEIGSRVYMSKPELSKALMFMEMDGLIAKDLFDRYIVLD